MKLIVRNIESQGLNKNFNIYVNLKSLLNQCLLMQAFLFFIQLLDGIKASACLWELLTPLGQTHHIIHHAIQATVNIQGINT